MNRDLLYLGERERLFVEIRNYLKLLSSINPTTLTVEEDLERNKRILDAHALMALFYFMLGNFSWMRVRWKKWQIRRVKGDCEEALEREKSLTHPKIELYADCEEHLNLYVTPFFPRLLSFSTTSSYLYEVQ